MILSPGGLQALETREGRKLTVYRDRAGLPTIGVGHRLTRSELASGVLHLDGAAVAWGGGLTSAQVDTLLRQDSSGVQAAVSALVLVPLTQGQFDALTSFTFNVGREALQGSTLLRELNAGTYAAVPAEMGKWIHDRVNGVEVVDPELEARRASEAEQWSTSTGEVS